MERYDNAEVEAYTAGVDLVMVTPQLAKEWLEKNKPEATDSAIVRANRRVRPARVAQYARDMHKDNWMLTAEPIKFSRADKLLDGQHRLAAVIQSGQTVPMFVAYNVPASAQPYMDSGAARTAADNYAMQGMANSVLLAAAARVGCIVDSDVLWASRAKWSISKAEIYEWVEDHPRIQQSCAFIGNRGPRQVLLPQSVKAYAHFRFAEIEPDEADRFFIALGSLVGLEEGTAIRALSSRLYQLGANRVKVELPDALSMLFRAWNAHRAGRRMGQIPVKSPRIKRELPSLV